MAERVIDRDRRLSESAVWDLSRAWYEHAGARAWSEGVVPSHATSNAFVADSFAAVALAFLRDAGAERALVVELGAGPGRFAHHFLRAVERRGASGIRYVATDFSASNVAALAESPALAPWRDAGALEVARFDLERDETLRLAGGDVLAPGALDVPLVIVANYVFCAVRQDAFRVIGGRLHDALASVVEEGDPGDLDRARIRWRHEPAPAPRYQDPAWEAALREHEALGEAAFLFPVAALAALDRMRAWTRRGTLLLAADRGDARAEAFAERGDASGVVHGALSFRANLHALGAVARKSGGVLLRAERPAALLETIAIAHGGGAGVARAFAESIGAFPPDDFFRLERGVAASADSTDVEALLAFLALARHDGDAFLALAPALARHASSAPVQASRDARARIAQALASVEAGAFRDARAPDVDRALGEIDHALGLWVSALVRLERALAARPGDAATLRALSRAHRALGRGEDARRFAEAALEASGGADEGS